VLVLPFFFRLLSLCLLLSFNLTGLQHLIPYFDYALDMILDVEAGEALSDDQQEMIENDAENLFGLIHARYILTTRGLQAMLEKYRLFHFGRCPRIYCRGQACLPIGISDVPNEEAVKLYWSVATHIQERTCMRPGRHVILSFVLRLLFLPQALTVHLFLYLFDCLFSSL
jgi:hypothetical protein